MFKPENIAIFVHVIDKKFLVHVGEYKLFINIVFSDLF